MSGNGLVGELKAQRGWFVPGGVLALLMRHVHFVDFFVSRQKLQNGTDFISTPKSKTETTLLDHGSYRLSIDSHHALVSILLSFGILDCVQKSFLDT